MAKVLTKTKWVEIEHNGITVYAVDFLNGVMIEIEGQIVSWPGYCIREVRGDTDGPTLWKRPNAPKEFSLKLTEEK